MHPSQEALSAYSDGELAAPEAATVERHARQCASCAGLVRRFAALDSELAGAPALSCVDALPLVSAAADGEVDSASGRIAEAHLAACAGCRTDADGWVRLDATIAALSLESPSARTDAALERFRHAPAPTQRRPLFGAPAWPARAGVAVAVALALLIAVPQQAGPELAVPAPEAAIVAAVQQSVLDPRTGTLYVLRAQEGAVAALDAATLAQRTVISVGGRPTALALSERTILVLDAEAKTLTSIDTQSNSVVAAQTVEVPGTPTSMQVDGTGKVHVASIIAPETGGGAVPSPASTAKPQSGAVTVIDPATKKVETINQLDVAPRQVVIEPSGKRALLVSPQGTTLVDAGTYRPLERVAGGIAAAFSWTSGEFAILSQRSGNAFVSFSGRPGVALKGSPRAIAPLSDGGYAVLTEVAGRGSVTQFSAEGTLQTEVASPAGRALTFDPLTGKLAVIGPDGVTVVGLPGVIAAAPISEPASPSIVVSVPTPSISAPASIAPAPSLSPAAGAAPSAVPSASPAPSAPVTVKEPDERASLVPTGARQLTGDTYLYEPARPGRATRVAGDRTRIWTLDASNQLSALHTATGQVFTVASLPKSARIASILPSPGYVYLTDPTAGTLYVVSVQNERWTPYPMPFLPVVVDAVTSPDDRLWLVVDGFGLVSFDPRSRQTEIAEVSGTRFSAVGVDATGRVWLSPRDRGSINVYDPYAARLTERVFPHDGSISAILVDPKGVVWIGTDTGQIFAMRDSRVDTAGSIGRAIDRLVLGPAGQVWYVSRTGGEVTFGPADGSALALHGPTGMSTPVFDVYGRAWAQDPVSGAFFVTLPAGGR